MKRLAAILIVVAALVVFPAASSHAQRGHGGGGHSGGRGAGQGGGHSGGRHGRGGWGGGGWYGRGGWGVGAPFWWWDPLLFPYGYPYADWYYPPPYYAYPSVAEQNQPSGYVGQESEPLPAPPEIYWYYCPSAKAYYPTVKKCREAWVKVPPRPE